MLTYWWLLVVVLEAYKNFQNSPCVVPDNLAVKVMFYIFKISLSKGY